MQGIPPLSLPPPCKVTTTFPQHLLQPDLEDLKKALSQATQKSSSNDNTDDLLADLEVNFYNHLSDIKKDPGILNTLSTLDPQKQIDILNNLPKEDHRLIPYLQKHTC